MRQRDDWHLTDSLEYDLGRGDPFAAAVRATRMPMVITDPNLPDNPIVFCNEAFQKLSGYSRQEIVGRNCRFLQGPQTDRETVTRVRHAIDHGHDIDVDLLNYRRDGSTFWNALYLSPVRDDDNVILFFFASQLDVTERVEAQRAIAEQKDIVEREVEARTAEIAAALEAKTLLLHEVDHRVKNNLTMIGALLRLQARSIADPAIAAKLDAMLARVDALATVHRRLYQSDDVTRFDVAAFTENLVADVVGASGRSDIEIVTDTQPILVSSNIASAIGLILNEVTVNAVKHAFADGRSGKLSIETDVTNGSARITIADDGPGVRDPSGTTDGLGRTLIARLCKQIDGKAEWLDAAPGARVVLSFPVQPS